jgi:hypothetical protein
MTEQKTQRFLMVAVIICLGLTCTAHGELIAKWTFNEDSGVAVDVTGNGQDATLVNSPLRITNGSSRYMELNGTNQYAWAPAGRISPTAWYPLNDAIVASNAVTVSAWVRVDVGTAFVGEPAIGKLYGGGYHEYGITFAGTAGTNGRVYSYAARSSSGQPTAAADSIFDGNWHNITSTFEGGAAGDDAKLYFDGTEVGSYDLGGTIVSGDLNFLMGMRAIVNSFDKYYFDGGIDEIQVYDAALSQAEVTSLIAAGPVLLVPPLLNGDANGDGVVSAADYGSVQANFGSTGTPGILGDANIDGFVSAGDYISVQSNFGDMLPAAETPVPEPATMCLLLGGGLALIRRRRNA